MSRFVGHAGAIGVQRREVCLPARGAVVDVDVLVNNAAATDVNRPFEGLTPERWEDVLRVNLTGALRCSEAVLEPMRAQARGKIIHTAPVPPPTR